MSNQKLAKWGIALPLIGLNFTWFSFLGAAFWDLTQNWPQYDNMGNYIGPEPRVELGTYLFLFGIAAASAASLWGQKLALKARLQEDNLLSRAAHRFTNLAIIISLVGGAVFAIGTFLGAFNNYDSRDASAFVRIFGVYVPIILATAMVVTLLLLAFVFRQDAPDLPHAEKDQERSKLQRAIGLAYASPIIGTAIAIIFGLIVYDTTKTTLDVWIWVVIQLIIAGSILLGTHFAVRARLAKPLPPRQRTTGAAAININLVLSIVFGVVVTIMAFSYGIEGVGDLRQWPEPIMDKNMNFVSQPDPIIRAIDLPWIMGKFLPALVLLALAELGIYKSLVVRNSQTKEEIA